MCSSSTYEVDVLNHNKVIDMIKEVVWELKCGKLEKIWIVGYVQKDSDQGLSLETNEITLCKEKDFQCMNTGLQLYKDSYLLILNTRSDARGESEIFSETRTANT